jgi:hypothetical protein
MLAVVLNWFLMMFVDTAIYRKSTTCNDLNIKNGDYMCFDVEESIIRGPIDCEDSKYDKSHVICYIKYWNFPVGLSLAFSFAQMVITVIHISFVFTLCSGKKCSTCCAVLANWIAVCLYCAGFIVYGVFMGKNVHGLKHYEGVNFFYGLRVMRIIMVVWGFVTLFLIACCSPYCWLEKDSDDNHRRMENPASQTNSTETLCVH